MTRPARRSVADSTPAVPALSADAGDGLLRRRCARDRAARQQHDAAVEQVLAARIAAMPEAVAELRQRVAECQRRRATDTCTGRCVIPG